MPAPKITQAVIENPNNITRSLTGVMFDNVDIWAYGEEDELFIYFRYVPITYIWDMSKHTLKVRYYDFEGTISHSFLPHITFPAVDIFCHLVMAAKECDEHGIPYVFSVEGKNPHNVRVLWGAEKDYSPSDTCLFESGIYPRRKRSES